MCYVRVHEHLSMHTKYDRNKLCVYSSSFTRVIWNTNLLFQKILFQTQENVYADTDETHNKKELLLGCK